MNMDALIQTGPKTSTHLLSLHFHKTVEITMSSLLWLVFPSEGCKHQHGKRILMGKNYASI